MSSPPPPESAVPSPDQNEPDVPGPPDAPTDEHPPLRNAAIVALLLGGLFYSLFLLVVFGFAMLFIPLELGSGDGVSESAAGSWLIAFALATAFFVLLNLLLRRLGLPHPTATLWFLTAAMGVSYLQLVVTSLLFGFSQSWFVSTAFASVVSVMAVLAVFASARGHGFGRAVVAVTVVVVLRAGTDWLTHVEEERERFNRVEDVFSEPPYGIAILESDRWSPSSAGLYGLGSYAVLDYEDADGNTIQVVSWEDFAAENPDESEPLLVDCDRGDTICEEFDEDGLGPLVLLAQDTTHGDRHAARLELEPGLFVEIEVGLNYASEDPDDGSGPVLSDVSPEELRELAGQLRLAGEGNGARLAEEITGVPRP